MNKQAKPLLTVYHRIGCHLCDQMVAELRSLQNVLQNTAAFEFELVDIDQDAELRRRYDVDVPVVAFGDEVVCYHFFDEELVRKAVEHG